MSAAPGFYGKVPARGDFIARRMPAGFETAWDSWLATLTEAVRERAGTDWPEVWLTAPLWRFVLGAGQGGVAGVLVASMDRVGRMFPFTILGPCDGMPEPAWFDALEPLVLTALEDGFDPETLDAALIGLGAPPPGTALSAEETVWWCRGSALVAAGDHVWRGLPAAAEAATLVLGE